uniref:LRRCT domain-containing protein n=1 Tax=Branchiostoma floridae TaxID=7739 RepID=C3ZSM8_BRAFL|eukprot:XP_002588419.1 hypothetical protein BRAFLDRAFT_63368 [Branchiostoma floridae]
MGRRWRHLLMFLLIILKEPNMPEAGCSCVTSSRCECIGITSIPQNLPTSICVLDLRANPINSIQPGAFANLTRLQLLDMSKNQLEVIQSGTFSNLTNLEVLWLVNNKITTIQPGAFRCLPRLEKLYLRHNKITLIQLGVFTNLPHKFDLKGITQSSSIQSGTSANLTRLRELYLSHNRIALIQPDAFANLPQLEVLCLRDNKISMIQPGTLANLTRLKELSLRRNKITMLEPGAFTNLPQLQDLSLAYNQITVIEAGTFANLPQLQMLDLCHNQITMIQAGAFANLPQLEMLDLCHNQITKFPTCTSEFANLARLHLCSNQITNIHSGALSNLSKLQLLDLRSNKMSTIPPSVFGFLTSIRSVKVDNNPWQCDCKMIPLKLKITEFPSFKNQILCAQPAKLQNQKLTDVNIEDMTCEEPTIPTLPVVIDTQVTSNNCHNDTVASRYNCYFVRNDGSKAGKTRATPASLVSITSEKPESTLSNETGTGLYPLAGFITGPVVGFVLVGTALLIFWQKRKAFYPPLRQNPNCADCTTNTVAFEMTGGHNQDSHDHHEDIDSEQGATGQYHYYHQYEDEDNQHGATGQYQATPDTNTIATVESGHDHRYEDMNQHNNQTERGRFQANTTPDVNTTAAVSSGHDNQTGERQSQANNDFNTYTATTRSVQHDHYEDPNHQNDHTGEEDQYRDITKSKTNPTIYV